MASPLMVRSSDWYFMGGTLLFGAGISGGGMFSGTLYSDETGVLVPVLLSGGGVGLGGSLTANVGNEWRSIECPRSFSAWQIHGCTGVLEFGAVALVGGAAVTLISARPTGTYNYFFEDHYVGDVTTGAALGGGYLRGIWRLKGVFAKDKPTPEDTGREGIRPVYDY